MNGSREVVKNDDVIKSFVLLYTVRHSSGTFDGDYTDERDVNTAIKTVGTEKITLVIRWEPRKKKTIEKNGTFNLPSFLVPGTDLEKYRFYGTPIPGRTLGKTSFLLSRQGLGHEFFSHIFVIQIIVSNKLAITIVWNFFRLSKRAETSLVPHPINKLNKCVLGLLVSTCYL